MPGECSPMRRWCHAGLVVGLMALGGLVTGTAGLPVGAAPNSGLTSPLPSPSWSQLHPTTSPPAVGGASMAYDAATAQMVLFGGGTQADVTSGDTWVATGTLGSWSEVATTGPSPRIEASMAYDPASGQVLLFGGVTLNDVSGTVLGDTWAWDGHTWKQVATTGPSPRLGASMVFDPESGRILLYGGLSEIGGTGTADNDLWSWDSASDTWTSVRTTGAPSVVLGSMAYDPASGQLLLFGGVDAQGNGPTDTWALDGATGVWSELSTTGPPGRRRRRHGLRPTYRPDAPFRRPRCQRQRSRRHLDLERPHAELDPGNHDHQSTGSESGLDGL